MLLKLPCSRAEHIRGDGKHRGAESREARVVFDIVLGKVDERLRAFGDGIGASFGIADDGRVENEQRRRHEWLEGAAGYRLDAGTRHAREQLWLRVS